MLVPTTGYSQPTQDPATTPRMRHRGTSVRSDKAPSPKARNLPMSNRRKAPKPNCHPDKEPSRRARSEPTHRRSPAPSPNVRKHPDPEFRCSAGWYDATNWHPGSDDHDRYSIDP